MKEKSRNDFVTATHEKVHSNSSISISKISNLPTRLDHAKFSREIGYRMREARVLSSLHQKNAAVEFGYQNSSKLAKIESGQSVYITPWLIRKASILYHVPSDYLLGITATMEAEDVKKSSLRDAHAFMYANFDRRHAEDIAMMTSLVDRISEIEKMIVLADEQAAQVLKVFDFVTATPQWQNIQAGNKLAMHLERLCITIQAASSRYKNLKKDLKLHSKSSFQLDLLLDV